MKFHGQDDGETEVGQGRSNLSPRGEKTTEGNELMKGCWSLQRRLSHGEQMGAQGDSGAELTNGIYLERKIQVKM